MFFDAPRLAVPRRARSLKAMGMRSFCESFQRTADGGWLCIERAALQGPRIRIEVLPGSIFKPGAKVEGLDLAGFLDTEDSVRAATAASLARVTRRARVDLKL
jgi:hypothetical protein